MSANPQQIDSSAIPQNISARLKRKLDKHLAVRDKKHGGKRINAGDKPRWAKNLTKNCAADVLREKNAKEIWSQLLEASDLKLRFEVLRYLTDRLEGRPFIQTDPALVNKQGATVNNDNRLQIAIGTLIPGASPKGKKAKQLAVEAKQLPVAEVASVSTDAPKS